MKLHFRVQGAEAQPNPACATVASRTQHGPLTDDTSSVTCLACRRSRKWKEANQQQRSQQ